MWKKPAEAPPSSLADKPLSQVPSVPQVYTPERQVASAAPVTPAMISNATRLTQGITLKGEVTGQADLYIDGEMEGNVHLPESAVTVGPNGRVSADIAAREIVVNGAVRGNLSGRERVVLGRASRVTGSIEAEHFVIEEGARFRGKVNMVKAGQSRNSRAPARTSDSSVLSSVPVPVRGGIQ